MSEEDFTGMLESYVEELCSRGAIPKESDMDDVPHDKRAYQLAFNYADFTLAPARKSGKPISLRNIASLRSTIDALGLERDVKVEEARDDEHKRWTPEELRLVKKGYADEKALFEEHFPRDQFPSVYLYEVEG